MFDFKILVIEDNPIYRKLITEIIELEITDEGKGFDWRKISNPLKTDDIEKPGGKGIFLSKYYFDEFEYKGKGNIVRVIKKINQI